MKRKWNYFTFTYIPSRIFKDFRDPKGLVNFKKKENVLLCEFKIVALNLYQPLVSPRNINISSVPLFCSLRKVEQGMRYEYKWSSNYKQKGLKRIVIFGARFSNQNLFSLVKKEIGYWWSFNLTINVKFPLTSIKIMLWKPSSFFAFLQF